MKRFIAMLILTTGLIPCQAFAQDTGKWTLEVPLSSFHWGENTRGYTYNSENFGIGVGYKLPNPERGFFSKGQTKVSATVYKDSFYETAFTGTVKHTRKVIGPLRVGGSIAAAYKGRNFTDGQQFVIAPLVSVELRVNDRITLNADGLPPAKGGPNIGFIAVSGTYNF